MGELLQEIAELIVKAIQKYMENKTVLPEDLIPGKMQQVEEIPEKEQQVEEIPEKEQQVEEIFDFKRSWIIFQGEIEERFEIWMGSLDLLEEQEGESPDASTQYNEDLNELRNQLGKIYNTDFWGLKLTQLTGLATVYVIEKDQNRGL